jgi:hypothetical protein
VRTVRPPPSKHSSLILETLVPDQQLRNGMIHQEGWTNHDKCAGERRLTPRRRRQQRQRCRKRGRACDETRCPPLLSGGITDQKRQISSDRECLHFLGIALATCGATRSPPGRERSRPIAVKVTIETSEPDAHLPRFPFLLCAKRPLTYRTAEDELLEELDTDRYDSYRRRPWLAKVRSRVVWNRPQATTS